MPGAYLQRYGLNVGIVVGYHSEATFEVFGGIPVVWHTEGVFCLVKVCYAVKGIDNTPTREALGNLATFVDNLLDQLREAYGKPIKVNSGYRCPKLNKAVGGSAGNYSTLSPFRKYLVPSFSI